MELIKPNKKISVDDYTTKEYVSYFKKYDGKFLCILTEEKFIRVKFCIYNLPHMIGLQYAYDSQNNKKSFKGKLGYEKLLNNKITFNQIKKNVNKNKITSNGKRITWSNIQSRIELLPFMFENMTNNPRIRTKINDEMTLVNSQLKGDYYYFKYNDRNYLILSLAKINDSSYTIETFIVYDNIRFLGPQRELNILNVYWE